MQKTEESGDINAILQRIVTSDDVRTLVSHPDFNKNNPTLLKQIDRLANMLAVREDNVMSIKDQVEYEKATGTSIHGEPVKSAPATATPVQPIVKESSETVDKANANRRHLQQLDEAKAAQEQRRQREAEAAIRNRGKYGSPTNDDSPIDGASVLFK